jgi:hypothetical protein
MRSLGFVAVVAAVAVALSSATPAGAARTDSCTASSSRSTAAAGSTVVLAGTVSPGAFRPVQAQVRSGTVWTTAATATADALGHFSFTLTVPSTGPFVLRVNVPRTPLFLAVRCGPYSVAVTPPPGVSPGTSFRAVYALASDQTADPTAVAAITNEINQVNAWFGTQTQGNVQPRWIRSAGGAPTVTTVKLAHTAAQYAAGNALQLVSGDLAAAAPLAAPTEKTVVWINVSAYACGETSGNTTILYEAACGIYPLTNSGFPAGGTYLLAHELTHNLGAVPLCAPHSDGTGHVNDDNRDILYQGPSGRNWASLMLDPGHDDYYLTGKPACPGIESSPFWTKSSSPGS